jgi:hypothetical protein
MPLFRGTDLGNTFLTYLGGLYCLLRLLPENYYYYYYYYYWGTR